MVSGETTPLYLGGYCIDFSLRRCRTTLSGTVAVLPAAARIIERWPGSGTELSRTRGKGNRRIQKLSGALCCQVGVMTEAIQIGFYPGYHGPRPPKWTCTHWCLMPLISSTSIIVRGTCPACRDHSAHSERGGQGATGLPGTTVLVKVRGAGGSVAVVWVEDLG